MLFAKHNDRYPNYDPSKDLTKEQLQRFTQAANSASISVKKYARRILALCNTLNGRR